MVHMSYLKIKINKNQNISIQAPLSAARVDIFQFIQKIDYNTGTTN